MFKVIKLKSIIATVVLAVIAFLGLRFFAHSLMAVQTAATEGKQPVFIVMYHSVLKNAGSHATYVITPDQLEKDIVYLKENGFEFVTFTDLVSYVNDEAAVLPAKPVVITFDDGYYNNYEYAFPIMKKHNVPCVISVVGEFTDEANNENGKLNPRYSYLTWELMNEMQQSGLVEIQNHTYALHRLKSGRRGAKKKKGESYESYEKLLTNDVTKLQEALTEYSGITPNALTYPFGEMCKESEKILKELGFAVTVSASEGINYLEKGNPDSLYALRRYNRPGGKSSEGFFKRIIEKTSVRLASGPPETPDDPPQPANK